MQNAMFSGLFAALTTESRLSFISNNLANVNTAGYKTDKLSFKDTMVHFASDYIREPLADVRSKPLFPESQLRARTRIAVSQTDFTQGAMQSTGNPLDFAITGEGFFKVQLPNGEEQFTRNGSFCQNADGTIVTKQGWPVLGENGPITIPPNTRSIEVAANGQVSADGVVLDIFQFTAVEDLKQLEKLGGNNYRARPGSNLVELPANADNNNMINQGFLEASNVDVVLEMVKMIETQREFEATQKAMQTADTVDREAITKVGRPR